jgi:hypothetical protein
VIGKLLMLVNKNIHCQSLQIGIGGERWWKKEHVVMEFVNQFLLPDKRIQIGRKEFPQLDWKKGVPHSWIRQEWHTALIIIHRNPGIG